MVQGLLLYSGRDVSEVSQLLVQQQDLSITLTTICVTAAFCHQLVSTGSYASMYGSMYSDVLHHSREHTNKQRYGHRKNLLMRISCYFLYAS